MEAHVLKLNKVPLFAKNSEYVFFSIFRGLDGDQCTQTFQLASFCPKLALVPASRYNCDVK